MGCARPNPVARATSAPGVVSTSPQLPSNKALMMAVEALFKFEPFFKMATKQVMLLSTVQLLSMHAKQLPLQQAPSPAICHHPSTARTDSRACPYLSPLTSLQAERALPHTYCALPCRHAA